MTEQGLLAFTDMASPVGRLTLVAGDAGLRAILWEDDDPSRVKLGPQTLRPDHPVLRQAVDELSAYFTGTLRVFSVPLDFKGTDFQVAVWRALTAIPYGETRSYGDIATRLGRPSATRAVGAANGRNPISIIAPCHRVIGASGRLTGFAGGLEAKAWLLSHESGGRLL
ncbi:MAG: methylated-DNA--[protein]-cysteine S-methyltransferase [Asticcacaulis sp.]